MSYYVRILTKSTQRIPFDQIRDSINSEQLNVILEIDDNEGDMWDQFLVKHSDDTPICFLERNEVNEDSLASEEIDEFKDEILGCKPESAVSWLDSYLSDVKVIYAFQLLSGTEKGRGWDAVQLIQNIIWGTLGGIFQADNEGFSNEEGYHILWQFSDGVKGPWNMAVIDSNGKWINFEMDLGNKRQRQEFFEGQVPNKAKIL